MTDKLLMDAGLVAIKERCEALIAGDRHPIYDARLVLQARFILARDIPALLTHVEAQAARIRELEAALGPFAEWARRYEKAGEDSQRWLPMAIDEADLRRAAEALEEQGRE